MKKYALSFVLFAIPMYVYSNSDVITTDTRQFGSMKACVEWIDSIYPNKEWHSKGMPWYVLDDTPNLVVGSTNRLSSDGKLRYPIAFQCEIHMTGTKGTYFEGTYSVLKSRSN